MKELPKSPKNRLIAFIVFTVLFLSACIVIAEEVANQEKKPTVSTMEYSYFEELLDKRRIRGITLDSRILYLIEGGFVEVAYDAPFKSTQGTGIVLPDEFTKPVKSATILIPLKAENIEAYLKQGVEFNVPPVYSHELTSILLSILPYMFFLLFLCWMLKKQMTGFTPDAESGTSIATTSILKFTDVAGMTEEKQELQFAIESLKNREKYLEKGARPVKGILLEGPPGVGKTMLAKAIAGEAGVKFLAFTGSDFVEMFVGLGAQRIRKMYKTALENKPCVVFIDEIDALGQKRNSHGGNAENDNTLVALLSKMDGMSTESGILFIAATNRVDTLDSALLRPGRFDKVIHIGPPRTKEDREAIVNVHLRNKQLADGVTLEQVAKLCFGLTGAEIEQSLNDAVIESFKEGNEGCITLSAMDKAVMKTMTKGIAKGKNSGEELKRVAIHELGHALVNSSLGRSVVKISVQPYTSGVGGITMIDGETANIEGLRSKQDIEDDIKVLYGGYIAEKIMTGTISTGASNDLERATILLKHYVGTWAMKDGMLLSLNALSQDNPMAVDGKLLIDSMETVAERIYNEVYELLNSSEQLRILQGLLPILVKDEVIYNLDEAIESLDFVDDTVDSYFETNDDSADDLG